METGTVLFETWVPTGGFKLERRKGKTSEGAVVTTDWLVPAWSQDDLAATRPCTEQPCLHRVLADCRQDRIVHLAGLYGLLTATGKTARADALPARAGGYLASRDPSVAERDSFVGCDGRGGRGRAAPDIAPAPGG